MRKIRLDVEQLAVESFATQSRARAAIGTVRGNGIMLGDGILMGDGFDAVANPVNTPNCSADTNCDTCRFSCIDTCAPQATCDSCFVTRCKTQCA